MPHNLLGKFTRYALLALLLAVLAIFLIWPIVLTVQGAFAGASPWRYFFDPALGVLRDPVYLAGLGHSLLIALATTALCLLITIPLAVLAVRCDFPAKTLLTGLMLLPLILPPFVGAIGVRAILGRFGAVNALLAALGIIHAKPPGVPGIPGIDFLGGAGIGRLGAIILMEALHLYPILYLNLAAALANLDPALDEAARNLGAGRWRRFRLITVPLILPGVFAGATIVFIWSFTELGTPLMFDYYSVTPVQIFWGIQEVRTNPRPYALVVVMLVASLLIYAVGKLLLGGRGHAMTGKATVGAAPRKLRGPAAAAVSLLFVSITALAVLPHLGVVLSSLSADGAWYRSILPKAWTLDHYAQALAHPLAIGSIRNSLIYASAAMALATVAGLAISYLTVRVRVRGSTLLDSLAMLPLAVPGLVMAFGYVAMSLRWPFAGPGLFFKDAPFRGWFDIVGASPNPVTFLIVAYAVRRLPYVVRAASAGLEQTSGQLEEAALNLGASAFTTIRKIVVPLIMANLIAGAILTFSFAMLEVSDSLILAQQARYFPITKAIFELYNRLGDGPYIASAMGVWGMALLPTITLVGATVLMGKKLGALFRV